MVPEKHKRSQSHHLCHTAQVQVYIHIRVLHSQVVCPIILLLFLPKYRCSA